jgi:hypothetical protein
LPRAAEAPSAAAERWLIAAALLAIVAGAAWLRISAYRQANGHFQLAQDTAQYVSMAENLRHGLGWTDARQMQAFRDDPWGYRFGADHGAQQLTGFYQNDLGLSLLYALAGGMFGASASPPCELLWLQIAADCLNVLLIWWLAWRGVGAGWALLFAGVYAGLSPLIWLSATFPYYYYWTACFALWNLAAMIALLGCRPHAPGAPAALVAYGALLGFASMVRSSFLPLGLVSVALLAWDQRQRWRAVLPWLALVLVMQGTVMAPVVWRTHQRFGAWMPPRLVWHTIYTGLGWRDNRYGIQWDDQATQRFVEAHGIRASDPDYQRHYEELLASEVHRIDRDDPLLRPRNALLNTLDGLVWFDQPLTLWGRELPAAPRERGLLLLAALALLGCLAPPRLRQAVLLQGLYFVVGVSMLCPPFAAYNAAYLPTLTILLALLVYGAARVLCGAGYTSAAPAPRGSPVVQAGSRAIAVAASGAFIAMWLPLGATYMVWVRLPLLLTVPWLAQRFKWNRPARVGVLLAMLLIAPGHDSFGQALRWLYALWPYAVLCLAAVERRVTLDETPAA